MKAATQELQLRTKTDGKNKEEQKNERQTAQKEKVLQGQFMRETEEVAEGR